MIVARLAGDTIEENYIWNYVTRKRENPKRHIILILVKKRDWNK